MYSKCLSLCPLFTVYLNVAWLSMVLRGFTGTQKRSEDGASPWNIIHLIEIFAKDVPHAARCVFYWFIDS